MKNIKNIITLLKVIVLLFVISSCDNDDEFVPPNEFVDVAFTTNFGTGIKEMDVNDFSAFLDLSAGATYHEWRIPETAFFLKGPIPGNAREFDQFIINPGDTVTNDRTAIVLFKEADSLASITLYNEFDEFTEFILNTGFDTTTGSVIIDTTRTELRGDKWVYEYTFTVDVYDTIIADMAIRDINGNAIDFKNMNAIDLKFNDKLIFEDLSGTTNNARPTATSWRVHTREENENDEIDIFNSNNRIDTITFNQRIGSFRGELISSRERTENVSNDMQRFNIPTTFNVTALDASFVQNGVVEELPDGTIQIPFDAAIADFGNNPVGSFTVNVNGSPVTISSVLKSSTNANFLIVTLETGIGDTDVVAVSYDGSGGLQSIDERPLEAFSGVSVVNYIITPVIQTGAIIELEDETIQVPFDVDFDPATFAGDTTEGFEVLVNSVSFPLASVSIDVASSSTLNITLVDPIFRPDVITVSHDGSGDIRTIGGGAIAPFTTVPVEMHDVSLLTDSDFEGEIDGATWIATTQAGGSVEFTTEQAFSGSKSAKMVNNRPRLESRNELLDFPAGTYTISYQRFVPTSVDLSALPATVGDKFNVGPKNITITWDSAGPITQGVWEAVEGEITLDALATGAFIRIQPVPTSGDLTVFLDNFKIQLKEERP